ncbi:hypothetical protein R1flu_020157 [Riccia fluitans]|uniref:Uncharacterized protein n=1 Tax=Riccia fluitans TaxID=41844 RepID=A0ABD1ZP91_9MARC
MVMVDVRGNGPSEGSCYELSWKGMQSPVDFRKLVTVLFAALGEYSAEHSELGLKTLMQRIFCSVLENDHQAVLSIIFSLGLISAGDSARYRPRQIRRVLHESGCADQDTG